MNSGFTGFSIAKKPAPKPTGKSNLATSSSLSATKPSLQPIDKHEELRRVTEAAKIELQKDDVKAITAALEEDPTLFDYSDYYDEMQSKMQTKRKPVTGNAKYGYGITISDSGTSKGSSAPTPQSRYIDGLLSKAREREAERELILERQRHKENQKYEEMFGETESFVTPEYQAKLEEDQRKREELDRRDRLDAGTSSMANFHSNLRRATLAGDSDALSAPEPSSHHQNPLNLDSKDSNGQEKPKDTHAIIHQTPNNTQNDFQETDAPSGLHAPPRQSLIAQTTRKPRRHTDDMIEEAKKRYQLRKEQKERNSIQT